MEGDSKRKPIADEMIFPEDGVMYYKFDEYELASRSKLGPGKYMLFPATKKYLKSMRIINGKGLTLYIGEIPWFTIKCDDLSINFHELLKANFTRPGEDIKPICMAVAIRYYICALQDLVNVNDDKDFKYPDGWNTGLRNPRYDGGQAEFFCYGSENVFKACEFSYDFTD